MFAQLQSETVSLRLLIGVDSHDGEQEIITWQHLVARGAELVTHRPALDWLRPSPDDVTELMFTSGTTGEPKGVLHTANTLNSAAVATMSFTWPQRWAIKLVSCMACACRCFSARRPSARTGGTPRRSCGSSTRKR